MISVMYDLIAEKTRAALLTVLALEEMDENDFLTTRLLQGNTTSMNEDESIQEFLSWLHKSVPFTLGCLPVIMVSLGFLIATLISAMESFRCQQEIQIAAELRRSEHEQASVSKGDRTRLIFYKLLTTALLARCLCLPWEGYVFYSGEEQRCMSSPTCILTRSLPDVLFATMYSILVFFFAHLAGMASAGGPTGLNLLLNNSAILVMGNILVYGLYAALLLCAYLSIIPLFAFQLYTWALLLVLYGSLLVTLMYFGPVLAILIGPMANKPIVRTLARRGMWMGIVCLLVFVSRVLCFGLAILHRDGRYTHGLVPYWTLPIPVAEDVMTSEDLDNDFLMRDIFGYTLLELLPSFAILFFMHQKGRRLYRKPRTVKIDTETTTMAQPPNEETRPLLGEDNLKQEQVTKGSSGDCISSTSYGTTETTK